MESEDFATDADVLEAWCDVYGKENPYYFDNVTFAKKADL
jgi:hypothetical protein